MLMLALIRTLAVLIPWLLNLATWALARSLNISIGVSDPGLSSAFGVTMRDGLKEVEERAARFRQVAGKYLKN